MILASRICTSKRLGTPKVILLVVLLFLSVFTTSCITDPLFGRSEMRITSIYFTENTMVIEIERWRTRFRFDNPGVGVLQGEHKVTTTAGLHFPSRAQEIKFEEEWHRWRRNVSRATLTMDLTDITTVFFEQVDESLVFEHRNNVLYLNREAFLAIGLSGAVIEANIFLTKGDVYILSQYYKRMRLFP